MRVLRKALVTVASLAALIGGGLAFAGPAAAETQAAAARGGSTTADEWEGPIDSWTTFPVERGMEYCHTTGAIAVMMGIYREYKCEDDGWWTTYLYIKRW